MVVGHSMGTWMSYEFMRYICAKGVPLLKHQHWSGAELMDQMMSVATGGSSSTSAMGAGVTEAQFVAAGGK